MLHVEVKAKTLTPALSHPMGEGEPFDALFVNTRFKRPNA
jgi:hypothetical protein